MPTLSMPSCRPSSPFRTRHSLPSKLPRRSKGRSPSSTSTRALACLLVPWLMIAAPAFGLPLNGLELTLEQTAAGLWEAIWDWMNGILGGFTEVAEQGETHDMGFEIEPNG